MLTGVEPTFIQRVDARVVRFFDNFNPGEGSIRSLTLIAAIAFVESCDLDNRQMSNEFDRRESRWIFDQYEQGAGYQTPEGTIIYPEVSDELNCSVSPDGSHALYIAEWGERVGLAPNEFSLGGIAFSAFNEAVLSNHGVPDVQDQLVGHCLFAEYGLFPGSRNYYVANAFSAEYAGDWSPVDNPFTP